jgi:hypothetical protein
MPLRRGRVTIVSNRAPNGWRSRYHPQVFPWSA